LNIKPEPRIQAQPTSAIDIARTTLEILQNEARLNELEARAEAAGAAERCVGAEAEERGKRASSALGRSFSDGMLFTVIVIAMAIVSADAHRHHKYPPL